MFALTLQSSCYDQSIFDRANTLTLDRAEAAELWHRLCRISNATYRPTREAVRRGRVLTCADGWRANKGCCTELLKRGANPYHIKDLFAHSDLETSSIYISSQMDDLRDTVRLLDVPEVEGIQ